MNISLKCVTTHVRIVINLEKAGLEIIVLSANVPLVINLAPLINVPTLLKSAHQ